MSTLVLLGLPMVAVAVAGCAVAVIGLLVKERKQAETRMQVVEASATALFRAIPDGVVVLRQHEIVAVNTRLCELLGCSSDTLVGASWLDSLSAPEHRHEMESWLDGLALDGHAEGMLVLSDPVGRRVAVEAAGRVITDDGSTPRHVVTIRDVSASRRDGERLAEIATRDPLTGLLNNRGFQERLLEEVRRARLGAKGLSLALVDLGPSGLDEMEFAAAAQLLRRDLRTGEHLARTRDREIAWILPATDAAGAAGAIERMRTAMAGSSASETLESNLLAGVCDIAKADDARSLYALASRALDQARDDDAGSTVCFAWAGIVPTTRQEPVLVVS